MRKSSGFTIVELLIVVVVIAILAAITIVSFNGITARANDSAVKTGLSNTIKKLGVKEPASAYGECYTDYQTINTSCITTSDALKPLPIKNLAKNTSDAMRYYMDQTTPVIAAKSSSGAIFLIKDGVISQINEPQYLSSNASNNCGATATYSTVTNTWTQEPHYC
jgi:prepilin-type N-terminal cleavage/methylation domain-containing protein